MSDQGFKYMLVFNDDVLYALKSAVHNAHLAMEADPYIRLLDHAEQIVEKEKLAEVIELRDKLQEQLGQYKTICSFFDMMKDEGSKVNSKEEAIRCELSFVPFEGSSTSVPEGCLH